MTLKKNGAGFGEGGGAVVSDSKVPYLRVGNRHSEVGNRLSDRLGLVSKV